MVSPWMHNGNVRQYLERNADMDRYAKCCELVSAIVYLHDEGVVHGDLKGENILVSADGRLKLTDFGLAIMHQAALEFSKTTEGGGTQRWMAPELLAGNSERSKEADIYALGMTLLEMMTGQIPFHDISNFGAVEVMHNNLRPRRSEGSLTASRIDVALWKLLERCWAHEKQSRPTTEQVVAEMKPRRKRTITPVERLLAWAGRDLPRAVAPLAILAVGVGAEYLPGPDHDLDWISRNFSAVILYALKGQLATETRIRSALKHMFENAESVVTLVLYFTGFSNHNNMLKLYGGQPLSEATLFEWINEFRATTGKYLPVLLIFDIGRPSTSAPVVSTHELTNIYVIWACTPGESSYDANIDEDLPYSDLLKVLCLTLHKMRPSPPEIPKSVMRKITAQASRIVKIKRGIVCGLAECPIPWNECPCLICLGGMLCLHQVHSPSDRAPIKTPVAWFSGFGNDIDTNTALDAMQPILRYVIEPVRRAAVDIVRNRWYEKFVLQSRQSSRQSST